MTTHADIPGVIRWGNLPVPYVAAWSSETKLEIRPDPLVGDRPALFRSGRRGLGTPVFGKFDESRVRRVLVKQLCQVCAEPIRGAGYACDVPCGLSGGAPLLNEPPACKRCFEVSVAMCPGIQRMLDKPRVLVARVERYDVVMAFMKYVEGGTADLNEVMRDWKGAPVVGPCRPALQEYDVLNPADYRRGASRAS